MRCRELTTPPPHPTLHPQTPDPQAFELIQTAIEAGSTSVNTGYFYGNAPHVTANLQLLSRFFDAHPDLVDKVYISVKGGLGEGMTPNADVGFLREQLKEINSILKHRKMDLFEMARVDKATGIEQVRLHLALGRSVVARVLSLTLLPVIHVRRP